jgi:hypothetical protein
VGTVNVYLRAGEVIMRKSLAITLLPILFVIGANGQLYADWKVDWENVLQAAKKEGR